MEQKTNRPGCTCTTRYAGLSYRRFLYNSVQLSLRNERRERKRRKNRTKKKNNNKSPNFVWEN